MLEEKRKEMDEKERKRKELIHQQQEEMKELARIKQEEHAQKIAEVMAKNDEAQELRRIDSPIYQTQSH